MNRNIRLFTATALVASIAFTSCKKEKNTDKNTGNDMATELTMHAEDQSRIAVEMDAVAKDAALATESSAYFSGSTLNATPQICDAAIAYDTSSSTKKIIITYNGATCTGKHIRSGSVTLSMPKTVYWKTAGATITIAYQNLKLTRVRDNKSITLNGSHSITNVSGGLLIQLPILKTITHILSGDLLSITFENNTQRTWALAQKRVFTYNDGVVMTVTGEHTEGSKTNIAAWGTNRFGHPFTTAITQPLIIKQSCDFRITSGTVVHEGFATATAMYGLDKDGNATSCPSSGTYFCKLSWTGTGGSLHSTLFEY